MADPVFNDPALRQALAEGRDAIEGRSYELDAVSADIKALEAYLWSAGIRGSVAVPMGGVEFLWWDHAEPDRWRIVWRIEGSTTARILIEAKADVRLRARAALPALLRKVAEAIGAEQPSQSDPDTR